MKNVEGKTQTATKQSYIVYIVQLRLASGWMMNGDRDIQEITQR